MAGRACHCADFSRGRVLREAAAQAGRGLPSVEPGMPIPAGTGLSRRTFLLRSAGLALSVYGAALFGPRAFEEGIARAAGSGPVLVSVFLDGGADSLSLLFPDGDAEYRRLRPTLALEPGSGLPFAEDERLRWHPALEPLARLHGEGKVTTLPAVGYTHVDQSHFTSRHYWEVGATSTQLATGWLGRYLDHAGSPDNPLQGLSLDGELAPSIATTRVPVAAVSAPDDYDFWAPGVWGDVEDWMLESFPAIGAAHSQSRDPALRDAGRVAAQSGRLRQQLAPFGADKLASPVAYPEDDSGFAKRLGAIAAILAAGLPLRCVALSGPGDYDTHDNQADSLPENLKTTADGLFAFQRDLEARGLADRVLVQVWSEFGRRAEENDSGTDHGAAGLGLLIGARARGTMVGEFPGVDRLDEDGNLRATSDFRAVYCGLLEQWLGHDAAAVIPEAGRFRRPALVR
jgi:uncharacterized protein (DUF1501 family)